MIGLPTAKTLSVDTEVEGVRLTVELDYHGRDENGIPDIVDMRVLHEEEIVNDLLSEKVLAECDRRAQAEIR